VWTGPAAELHPDRLEFGPAAPAPSIDAGYVLVPEAAAGGPPLTLMRVRMPRSAFAFMTPEEGRGNIGRNTFRRGGADNLNASLQRSWRWSNEVEMRLRGESVNAMNTPQFAEPGSALVNPNFGRITNTLNEGRTFRFELGLRF